MTAPQPPGYPSQYPPPQYPPPQQSPQPYPPAQQYPPYGGQPQYPPYGQQQQYAGFGQPYGPPPTARDGRRAEGLKQLVGGLVALGAGLAITIGTYALASGGGVYFVAYGPMIFGAIYVIKGLVN